MYYVYVIKSYTRNYIYVGITDNPERRIDYHNKGYNRTTKPFSPFWVILTEIYDTRPLARKREIELKSGAGKAFLKNMVDKIQNEDQISLDI